MQKNLHKVLEILMTAVILLLSYFLPGQVLRQNSIQKARESMAVGQNGAGVIVIDPGHGGSDPGMVGIDGAEEKTVNLEIAEKLQEQLEKDGYTVVLTRTQDAGLYDETTANRKTQDMQRRCALIEEKDPLLTVSIHQNSYSDASVYGPQVFYYEHSVEAEKLAACIQEKMNTQLNIARPRTIKANQNYYILKRSPSVTVLIECGFLSNPEDVSKLTDPVYQTRVARSITAGILAYLGPETGA